jgi:uncharacterized YceG family protein
LLEPEPAHDPYATQAHEPYAPADDAPEPSVPATEAHDAYDAPVDAAEAYVPATEAHEAYDAAVDAPEAYVPATEADDPYATQAHDPVPEWHADDARTAAAVDDWMAAPPTAPAPLPRRQRHVRRPHLPAGPRGPRGGAWRARIAALVPLAAIGVALYVINATFQPLHGDGSGSVAVTIPEGTDAGRIGDLLAEHGVIDSATFFRINATLTGRRGNLHPGAYTLRRGMTNGEAIDALTGGPKAKVVKTVKVTIPEGPSIRETAGLIAKSPVDGAYAKAAAAPAVLRRVHKLGAPRRAKTAEGFLFPATYDLADGATASRLVDAQLGAFADNFAGVDLRSAKRKNLTRYDVLIIASMVEREAQLDKERPLVAAVIYNRLKQGMPLGIDATIRYETRNWARPIRQSELDADTPYNTRLRRGLPPTPIGNPGLASIKAAANPAKAPYLFYVRKPGDSGAHAFSSTDAQFQKDVERYQASRGQ